MPEVGGSKSGVNTVLGTGLIKSYLVICAASVNAKGKALNPWEERLSNESKNQTL